MKRAMAAGAALFLIGAGMPAGRVLLGQYGRWGAFRDSRPHRCYAITAFRDGPASLAVSTWPERGVRLAAELRLPRPATAAMLRVDDRPPVALAVAGDRAWAASPAAAERFVAALRHGAAIHLIARDDGGHRQHLVFATAGAPSAIDAALVGCLAG